MSARAWAIPRTGPIAAPQGADGARALPLAGSRLVRFEDVGIAAEGGAWQRVAVGDLPADLRATLSAPRAAICGMDMSRPNVMGIVNVTPDSFSDGGDRLAVRDALAAAQAMTAAGADILDIGGESTRPGAEPVPTATEIARVVPAIQAIRAAGLTIPISIDTRKAAVAAAALDAGADMVNDVSAMTHDAGMAALVAERGVPICLMHAQGDPRTMQNDPRYDDVLQDVYAYLAARIDAALAAGIAHERILADPGIGFGKTLQHNLTILRRLSLYHGLGVPILLGASRKRFIGTIGDAPQAKDRMPGSLAIALHGAGQAVHILRVHDVRETVQALALWRAVNENEGG